MCSFFRLLGENLLNETLSNSSFEGLEILIYLDISRNEIAELPRNVFSPLWRLTTLNINHNHISKLWNESFLGLYNLNTL